MKENKSMNNEIVMLLDNHWTFTEYPILVSNNSNKIFEKVDFFFNEMRWEYMRDLLDRGFDNQMIKQADD